MLNLKEKKRIWYNSKLPYDEREREGSFYCIGGLSVFLTNTEIEVIKHHLKGLICFGLLNDLWIDLNGDDDYYTVEVTEDEIRFIIYNEGCPEKITGAPYCGQLLRLDLFEMEISNYIRKIEITTQEQKAGNNE